MIVLITATILTFFVVMAYLMSYDKTKELETKIKVLNAMTRTIKAAEEKGFPEKFKKELSDYVCDRENNPECDGIYRAALKIKEQREEDKYEQKTTKN